jgi:hypothetical protein
MGESTLHLEVGTFHVMCMSTTTHRPILQLT